MNTIDTLDTSESLELLQTLEFLFLLKQEIEHLRDNRHEYLSRSISYEEFKALSGLTISVEGFGLLTGLIYSLLAPGAAEDCLKLLDSYEAYMSRIHDCLKRYYH